MTTSPLLIHPSVPVLPVKAANSTPLNIPAEPGDEAALGSFAESMVEAQTPNTLAVEATPLEEELIISGEHTIETMIPEAAPLWISKMITMDNVLTDKMESPWLAEELPLMEFNVDTTDLSYSIDSMALSAPTDMTLPEVETHDLFAALPSSTPIPINTTMVKAAEPSNTQFQFGGNNTASTPNPISPSIESNTSLSTINVNVNEDTGEEGSIDSTLQIDVAKWLKTDAGGIATKNTHDILYNAKEFTGTMEKLIYSQTSPVNEIISTKPAIIETAPPLTPQSTINTTSAIPAAAENSIAGRFNISIQMTQGNAQWVEALTERAAWAANQKIQSAEVQLDPPELGYLQVKISVQNDQAVVNFVSGNAAVRDALEQNMPRLRELLQEQGLQLTDSGVSDQRQSQHFDSDEILKDDTNIDSEFSNTSPITLEAKSGIDDFV